MNTDDEEPDRGGLILLTCLACTLLAAGMVVAELVLTSGPARLPSVLVTALAPLTLVRVAAAPLRAAWTRRRVERARRWADSLRLEQVHERTTRRPEPRPAAATLDVARPVDTILPDGPETRSIDLHALGR